MKRMTSEEIRHKPHSGTLNDLVSFVRELTAQVAEMNERSAKRHESGPRVKRPKTMTSSMRPNGKKFYHSAWQITAGEDMLSMFTPHEGQKWPSELEVSESSTGSCGELKSCTITRKQ